MAYAALGAGTICFLIYVLEAVAALRVKPAASEAAGAVTTQAKGMAGPNPVSIDELTKLIEAMSKLTDSLAKAGPSLTSLIGAILFFAIAAVASGAITGSPPAPIVHSDTAGTKHEAPVAPAQQPKDG